MPKETAAQATKRKREEVAEATERVRMLVREGKADSVKALVADTDKIIGSMPAKERTALREALREAATAPSTELETQDHHAIEGMAQLIDEGVESFVAGIDQTLSAVESARELARHILRIHVRITNKHGLPDLTARSMAARNASAEVLQKAVEQMPGNTDEIKEAGDALQQRKKMQSAGVTRDYIKSLDDDAEEAARFTACTDAYPDLSVSEAVYAHYASYGIDLPRKSQAEKMAEHRAAQKAAKEAAEADGKTLRGVALRRAIEPPADRARSAVKAWRRSLAAITPEEAEGLTPEEKAELRGEAEEALTAAKALYASLA